MRPVKDLLYTKGNKALDIARVTCFLGGLTFFGLSIADFTIRAIIALENGEAVTLFDPVLWGGGFAGFAGGAAGWMHFRAKTEVE